MDYSAISQYSRSSNSTVDFDISCYIYPKYQSNNSSISVPSGPWCTTFSHVHSCAGSVSTKCDMGNKDPMIWRWRKATKKYRNNVVQLLMSVVLCHKLKIEEMTRWFRMLTFIANSKSEYIHWDIAECGTIFRTVCLRNPRRTLFYANRELDVYSRIISCIYVTISRPSVVKDITGIYRNYI